MKIPITLAVGIDICSLERFHNILDKSSRRFSGLCKRILHPKKEYSTLKPLYEEYLNSGQSNKLLKDRIILQVAGSWALKEATFKTLDESSQEDFTFKEWFKCYNNEGKPEIKNNEYFLRFPDDTFQASISHDGGNLIAIVLRQKWVDVNTKLKE